MAKKKRRRGVRRPPAKPQPPKMSVEEWRKTHVSDTDKQQAGKKSSRKGRGVVTPQERVARSQRAKRQPRGPGGLFRDTVSKSEKNPREAQAAYFRSLPPGEAERQARALLMGRARAAGAYEGHEELAANRILRAGKDPGSTVSEARGSKRDARRSGKIQDKGVPPGQQTKVSKQEQEMGRILLRENVDLARKKPEDLAMRSTLAQVRAGTGVALSSRDIQPSPVRTRRIGDPKQAQRDIQAAGWRSSRNIYTGSERGASGRVPTVNFIEKSMVPEHREWLSQELADPHSAFNEGVLTTSPLARGRFQSAGQRRRVDTYVSALQQGVSHEDAMTMLKTERRGAGAQRAAQRRTKASEAVVRTPTGENITRKEITDVVEERYKRPGLKSKTERLAPTQSNFKYAVEVPRVNKISELEKVFPNLTEQDYVIIQQTQREELLERTKNNRWQIEDRMSAKQGLKGGDRRGPDRVVMFTTSFGTPTVTVPSDSLVGQYIIRKRKKMLRQEGVAKGPELRGRFPDATRDMHVVETAAGGSAGLVGRVGVFSKSGWRVGTKKSKNYGKPVPIGATLMTDASGRPIYDAQGNQVYTEGGSRRVDFGTQAQGLRVFVG